MCEFLTSLLTERVSFWQFQQLRSVHVLHEAPGKTVQGHKSEDKQTQTGKQFFFSKPLWDPQMPLWEPRDGSLMYLLLQF